MEARFWDSQNQDSEFVCVETHFLHQEPVQLALLFVFYEAW